MTHLNFHVNHTKLSKIDSWIRQKFIIEFTFFVAAFLADDDSETSPHDLEGNNSDLEFGIDETFHLKGHGSFTQMQVTKLLIRRKQKTFSPSHRFLAEYNLRFSRKILR